MTVLFSPLDALEQALRHPRPNSGSRHPTYGTLEGIQVRLIKQVIRGRRVTDYGCGNLQLSQQLLDLGARHVHAVDKERVTVPKELRGRLSFERAYFRDLEPTFRTAFISWPPIHDTGVHLLLRRAPQIIYLGTNMEGTGCGHLQLWDYLSRRKVLAYAPHFHNSLIVYGEELGKTRKVLPEEYSALHLEYCFSYEWAHEKLWRPRPGKKREP